MGPGRCVCRWAAARPRDRHTRASLGVVDLEARPGPAAAHRHRGLAPQATRRPPIGCCLWPHGCCGRRRARPPARLGNLTSFGAAPRSPPVPSGPSGALHTGGAALLMCAGCVGSKPGQAPPSPTGAAPRSPPVPSGPSGALHTSGAGSLFGTLFQAPLPPTGTAARPRRLRAPQPGPPDPQCGLACRAGILGLSAVCCYKRRQSEVFFVWISGPFLQTSSIRWLFC